MGWDMEDAGAEIERLEARLRAAEDVCVLYAWTGSVHDSPERKAAHELWRKWVEISGNNCSPEENPHLTEELINELADQRDATRTAALSKLLGELPTLKGATSPDGVDK